MAASLNAYIGHYLSILATCVGWCALAGVMTGSQARPPLPNELTCRIEGRATSGAVVLPGVAIVAEADDAVRAATSTEVGGTYAMRLAPNAIYRISADLTAFTHVTRELTLTSPPCNQTVDFQLVLRPRSAPETSQSPLPGRERGVQPPGPETRGRAALPQAPPGDPARFGRGRGGTAGQPRFQVLNVQGDANGTATFDGDAPEEATDVARLLPPGFSLQAAESNAIAINGRNDAASLDRGLMNDRIQAIRSGEFDPSTFQFAPGAAPPGGGQGAAGFPGDGGPFGPGGFVLGGRGGRGQSPYQGSINYTFGGSALDSPPYQLRPDVPVTQPQFSKNNFGATMGGPLTIPGLYANTNRRTNFQLNYTGNQSNNLFDQYATVPTEAMRNGDFSASQIPLIDPSTGQPLPGNQIPGDRVDAGSAVLLNYIPRPNLPGTRQNYHVSTTAHSASDNVSIRVTQNLSPVVPGGPAGGRGGRGGIGPAGRFGGPGGPLGGPLGRGGRGTNIMLTAQLQYRRTENEAPNVFPDLGGATTTNSLTIPVTLNVLKGGSIHNVTVSVTHATIESTNAFSGVNDVSSQAGIHYPNTVATEPLNWGVPTLSFSGFSGVRGASASMRTDNRLTTSYMSMRPFGTHRLRVGGDYRVDASTTENNSNARGTFTFTGVYASGGSQTAGSSGADFADFLLGMPQLATLQVGGMTRLRQRSFDAFIEDNWQRSAKLTFNLGLRYELAMPYVEVNGQMANLDVAPGFTAAAPVVSGESGPYTGVFPAGLINTDVNNLGPRLGVALRVARNTILRGGYSITYNSASYAAIARELVAQPPFAETETVIGTPTGPLTFADAFLSSTTATTNNWGVDRDYALGMIQTWNATFSRDVGRNWTISAGYTGTKGTDLDILRAPNRGPAGLVIPDVQAFTWESSGGHSILNAGNFQVRRRLASGISGSASYTLAKSMDNASSLGAGGVVVAQNDKDLESEWAVSSFDRRQQLSADVSVELPFGPNRHWLNNGGVLGEILGEWTASLTMALQSGTPYTARVIGAASDVARGTNGSLRADYTGAPIQLSNPTVDAFFNAAAFAAPAAGMFGDSSRNMIVGPGGRQLNGVLTRDVRLGGNRSVTLQINATNLLNTVQWSSIDTSVNSPTFGQVLSAKPMRTVTVSARLRF